MGLSAEALLLLALLTLSPGPDTVLTLRQALSRGAAVAVWTVAGISTGTVVHATLSGAGLSLVLERSPTAFGVVKFLGAAYLAYLGVRSLWAAWRGDGLTVEGPESLRSGYRDGLLTNLLNPKVALFYLGFLPQFIQGGAPFLGYSVLYGVAHAAMGLAWLGSLAVFAQRMRPWLAKPKARRTMEAVAGLALVGFGLRLALAHA